MFDSGHRNAKALDHSEPHEFIRGSSQVSANTFRAEGKRTAADLQSLNAIVADIDCHSGTIPAAHRKFRLDYI